MTSISLAEARRLALAHQGLLKTDTADTSPAFSSKIINQLGYIQIDTISVVARAHHHALWVRQTQYTPNNLDTLQKSGKIFEYWSHAAAYLPIQHYAYSLPRMHAFASGRKHWFPRNPKTMQYVLDRIKAEGPLMSKDFKPLPGKKSGIWWDWKPAKIALEQLFHEGKLMVSHRKKFQKVYDLRENVLPSTVSTQTPSEPAYCLHLIRNTLQAHGIVNLRQIGYLRRGIKKTLQQGLTDLVHRGELQEIALENIPEPYYILSASLSKPLPSIPIDPLPLHILSPFDNLIIQRDRLQQLFNYDYKLECYVPSAKRLYGYFSFVLLYGDTIVGLLDPKADRKTGIFHIKQLHLTNFPVHLDKQLFMVTFRKKLSDWVHFNRCSQLHYSVSAQKSLATFLLL